VKSARSNPAIRRRAPGKALITILGLSILVAGCSTTVSADPTPVKTWKITPAATTAGGSTETPTPPAATATAGTGVETPGVGGARCGRERV
jgi:hypothetical protein